MWEWSESSSLHSYRIVMAGWMPCYTLVSQWSEYRDDLIILTAWGTKKWFIIITLSEQGIKNLPNNRDSIVQVKMHESTVTSCIMLVW